MTNTDTSLATVDPTGAIAMTAVRDGVKGIGALLIATGVGSQSQIQLYGGIVVVVAGVLWSAYVSYQKNRTLAVAHQAVTTLSNASGTSPVRALAQAKAVIAAK